LPTWFENGCRVIAEIAQNHDGSLGTAHAYIDAVAKTGADAIKFQTHIADAESTPGEPWRVRFSPQDATRFEYWKRMEFAEEQWFGLARHAADRGLIFLSSAFSFRAVDLLERIGVPAWKVGAGEITNLPMIERMARTGKPVLFSSGLASWDDLDAATATVSRAGGTFGIFQCTTAYPCPPEKLGLNVIPQIRERYRCPVGLSDHSGAIYAGLAAAVLGVDMIEVHAVFSRECFGPDVAASITTAELSQLVEGVRFIRSALDHPVDKQSMARDLGGLRTMFGKSVVAARDLPAGRRLREDDLALKKPGDGIPAARFGDLIDCTLKRAVAANTALREEDIEYHAAS
jgi:N,N'-diacetyllegionaminate synthase